jgi:hypothetical protein
MVSTMRRRPSGIEAVRIVGFGLLALATLSAAACGSMGPERSDPALFTWSGELKAPAAVRIQNTNGSIEVKPSEDDTVRVTAGARWHRGNPKTDLHFQVASAGSDVTICVLWSAGTCTDTESAGRHDFWKVFSKMFRGGRGTDANVTLTVFVPARVKVSASTLNGNVYVTATAPVKARTLNGNIKVATAIGPVDAETLNGGVDVRMTTLGDDGPVRAITVNGTATAYLPEKFDALVSISAANGRMGSDYAIATETASTASKRLSGTIGAGGRAVTVSTSNGTAWLHKLNADGTVAARVEAKP